MNSSTNDDCSGSESSSFGANSNSSSSSSSWDDDNDTANHDTSSKASSSRRRPRGLSTGSDVFHMFEGFHNNNNNNTVEEEVGWNSATQTSNTSFHNHTANRASTSYHHENNNTSANNIPTDQERQILLLMLLGQVCALHDPTPRTFTAHVLELFERGILDRQSIQFLYELGLVPSLSPNTRGGTSGGGRPLLLTAQGETDQELAIMEVPPGKHPLRAAEATAIRNTLERAEHERLIKRQASMTTKTKTTANNTSTSQPQSQSTKPVPELPSRYTAVQEPVRGVSFAAEHHPLSLSRYQREFDQIRLLSYGSFGYVYQATNKMDGRDYAIKRVTFNATGYSSDSVQQVVREVHCLAVCDHPHVVRYYTSWLEPSWMTGSGRASSSSSNSSIGQQQQKLLQDIQQLVSNGQGDGGSTNNPSDDIQAFLNPNAMLPSRRRYSMGQDVETSEMSLLEEEFSEWTIDADKSRDDSFLEIQGRSVSRSGELWQDPSRMREKRTSKNDRKYRYQIALFIQMQLCKPTTLADWIRDRNRRDSDLSQTTSVKSRFDDASEIFSQIANGLCHVHNKGIIHRDLKPANVFTSNDGDGLHFKIGDFGLSKLIQSATKGDVLSPRKSLEEQILAEQNDAWGDPLTAGVGTASYAAPEQVTSRTYGTEADIFSLGLILLELLCSFSTEHERMQTFHDCRQRRRLPDGFDDFPLVTQTILACTDPDAKKRPTASELANLRLVSEENGLDYTGVDVQQLLRQLSDKDKELEAYKRKLEDKQHTIDALQREVHRLKNGSPVKGVFFNGVGSDDESSPYAAASSSSSEDEL